MTDEQKSIVIDANTGQQLPALPMGLTGFMSWQRLVRDVFCVVGEIRKGETITAIRADKDGITFMVK